MDQLTMPAFSIAKVRAVITTIAVILITAILGSLCLYFAWQRHRHYAEAEAIQLAQSAAGLLPANHISKLLQNPQDRESSEYLFVKERMTRLAGDITPVCYAFIYCENNGEYLTLVNSTPGYSETLPLSDRLSAKNFDYAHLFEAENAELIQPVANVWGTWVRVLVPIRDPDTQNSIAALVMSYAASEWQAGLWSQMIPDIIVTAFLMLLLLILFWLLQRHTKLKEERKKLVFQEALYRNIFEQIPIGIILRDERRIAAFSESLCINRMAKNILGRSDEELKKLTWPDITHEDDLAAERDLNDRFIRGEIHSYSMEKRVVKPDGSVIWVNVKVTDFSENADSNPMYLCLLEDISARKKSEEALRESERSKSVFLSQLPGMAYRCKYDPDWTMEFVSDGCYALTGYKPESLVGNRGISFNSIIAPEHREFLWKEWERVLLQRKTFQAEYKIITKSCETKWVLELGQGVFDPDGKVEALEGIVLDISEQKEKEFEVTWLREHDFLTGLYNRNYMEQLKKRLDCAEYWPLTVFFCDIDGLRMINDAFSYAEGDRLIIKTAKLIQSCLRKEDMMGRITGGEFMLLLPNTNIRKAHQIKTDIEDAIDKYNNSSKDKLYAISLSIGYSTKGTKDQHIADIIKDAEEYLKHRKLLNRNSSHSAILSTIMATLYAKSQETEDHGQRLGRYCLMIGRELGLEQKCLSELYLVSKLHDIGKIGIEDSILNKPGKLTAEEWKKMKQHPEIGHRIAMSTPQLEHIAEYILYPHERWDGTGYPRGLKGEDIPVIARILSVADAFDAMTEDRVYRKAMPKEDALAEIKRNAGKQFDPQIADIFISLMQQEIRLTSL